MIKEIKNINIKGSIDKRICLISDIHFYRDYNLLIFKKIIDTLSNIKPDYICIPGDIIDVPNLSINELQVLYEFLGDLGKIAKVIVSLGNHDISVNHSYYFNEPYINGLKDIKNLYLLIDEEYIDGDIRFIGFKDNVKVSHKETGFDKVVIKDYDDLFKKIKVKNDKYNILLAHNPIYLVRPSIYKNIKEFNKIDLILSGHTHGGLVYSFIPGKFGIISPAKRFFPSKVRGKYLLDKTNLIISDGIMKLSHAAGVFHKFTGLFPISIYNINIKKEK